MILGDGKEQINKPLVCWKTWIGIGAHARQHIMRGRSWLSTSKDTFWILLVQSRGTSWTVHSRGASVLGLRDFTVCRGDSVSKVNQVHPSARGRGGYGLGVCGGTGGISYLSSYIRPIKPEESDSSTATISIIKFTDHYRFRENIGDPVASKRITLVHRRIKRKAGWFTEAGVTDRLLKFDYCLCDKNVEMIKP